MSWINFTPCNILKCRIKVQKPSWVDQRPSVTIQVPVISVPSKEPTNLFDKTAVKNMNRKFSNPESKLSNFLTLKKESISLLSLCRFTCFSKFLGNQTYLGHVSVPIYLCIWNETCGQHYSHWQFDSNKRKKSCKDEDELTRDIKIQRRHQLRAKQQREEV